MRRLPNPAARVKSAGGGTLIEQISSGPEPAAPLDRRAQDFQGSMTSSRAASKGEASRVATAYPRDAAIAAM